MSKRLELNHYLEPEFNRPLFIYMNELTAGDELNVEGVDTHSVVKFLDHLIDKTSLPESFSTNDLTASDRDWILSHLYQQYWPDRIVSSLTCNRCDTLFDLSFQLSELTKSVFSEQNKWNSVRSAEVIHKPFVDEHYVNEQSQKKSIRIPTFKQEQQLDQYTEHELIEKYLGQKNLLDNDAVQADFTQLCEWLEAAAPIIDLELSATCPHCGADQLAHFDIQSYFLQKLINEKSSILAEIHLLASSYGWSLSEIKDLPRSVRKSMAQLISDAS